MYIEQRLKKIRKAVKPECTWVCVFNDNDDLSKYYFIDPITKEKKAIRLDEARARWGNRDDTILLISEFVEMDDPYSFNYRQYAKERGYDL